MDGDPYYLPPSSQFVLNISGGRSSGFMLRRILDAHDGRLPPNAHPVFCNTGMERPETLDFVDRMAREWDVPIAWLEYRFHPEATGGAKDPKHCHAVVTYDTASRHGQPFRWLIEAKRMLPNVVTRFCTSELKVKTARRYMQRDKGIQSKRIIQVLGIRYDEPKRWKKSLSEHCDAAFPMVLARVTRADVTAFWDAAPFDLGIESWMGNCDLCFLKRKQSLIEAIRREPWRANWWMARENDVLHDATRRGLNCTAMSVFSARHSVADLVRAAAKAPTLPGIDDEPLADCFCGD